MNTKIRFLVLDARNQPVSPAAMGLKLNGITQSARSPSFLSQEDAVKFASLLATQNKANYYVAQVVTAVSGADSLDSLLAREGTDEQGRPRANLVVKPTTADGAGDE